MNPTRGTTAACPLVLAEYIAVFDQAEAELRTGLAAPGTRRRAYWRRDMWQDGLMYGLLADELEPANDRPGRR